MLSQLLQPVSHCIDIVQQRLKDALNSVAFRSRQQNRRLKHYREIYQDKSPLLNEGVQFPEIPWLKRPYHLNLQLQKRLQLLEACYPSIQSLQGRATRLRWLENLTILDYLDTLHKQAGFLPSTYDQETTACRWLDVGAKSWAYLDAQAAFINQQWLKVKDHRSAQLDAVEIDAYRRYRDGHCRADYAEAYIRALSAEHGAETDQAKLISTYWADDVRDLNQHQPGKTYHLITCFLPFVFVEPHQAWGLPKQLFEPDAFFKSLWHLLEENGQLVVINQGKQEARQQEELFAHLKNLGYGMDVYPLGPLPESFLPYQHTRWAFLCRKNLSPQTSQDKTTGHAQSQSALRRKTGTSAKSSLPF